MKIVKIYETTLNLSAVQQYSSKGIDATILEIIKNTYENKCEKNTLINKILEIVKRSDVRQSKNRLNGDGDVDIQFKAESTVYNQLEILAPCKIVKIVDNFCMLCLYNDTVVLWSSPNRYLVETLSEGQFVPIIIKDVSYEKGENKITVSGDPYFQPNTFIMYHIRSIDGNDESKNIDEEVNQIKKNIIKLKSKDDKIVNEMVGIYWPKNLVKKIEKIGKIIKIDELAKIKTIPKDGIVVLKHPYLSGYSDEICVVDKVDPIWFKEYITDLDLKLEAPLIGSNLSNTVYELYKQYENTVEMVFNMNKIIKTENEFKTYNRTWNAYKRY